MRTSCLVNHYNYARFVGDALDSVSAQTRPVDETIVVDDGSDPEELARLRDRVAGRAGCTLVEKPNEGQLSCFEDGVLRSEGELLFFLDADDLWEPDYVATVHDLFERRPEIDFVVANERRFFEDGREEVTPRRDRDVGYSVVRCLERGGVWLGGPTSCIAMRRWVAERIFPVPDRSSWQVCADEALVYGASVVGARKLLLGAPLVRYRVHGANTFYGRAKDPVRHYRRGLWARRFLEHLRRREGLPASLIQLAHREFCTIAEPVRKDYDDYRKIVRHAAIPPRLRRRLLWGLWTWYRLGRSM
jgi:glycosyltransferase involved in cell wall biosynthesis